jgi:hypothetical protein
LYHADGATGNGTHTSNGEKHANEGDQSPANYMPPSIVPVLVDCLLIIYCISPIRLEIKSLCQVIGGLLQIVNSPFYLGGEILPFLLCDFSNLV